MALKQKYASKQEIPAEHQSLYVEHGNEWLLDTEPDKRLEEFRATNVALLKANAEFKKRFEGIDPDAVRAMAEEQAKLKEEAQIKAGEVDKVIAARERAAVAAFQEKEHKPVVDKLAQREAQLTAIKIDQAAIGEATKRGILPSALPDLMARARMTFKLVGDVPQAFEADGLTPIMGKDGVTPKTLAEWVGDLVTSAPHFFPANAGGGAVGYGPGGAGNRSVSNNPWSEATRNVTEQMRLKKSDPALAARLQAAAV